MVVDLNQVVHVLERGELVLGGQLRVLLLVALAIVILIVGMLVFGWYWVGSHKSSDQQWEYRIVVFAFALLLGIGANYVLYTYNASERAGVYTNTQKKVNTLLKGKRVATQKQVFSNVAIDYGSISLIDNGSTYLGVYMAQQKQDSQTSMGTSYLDLALAKPVYAVNINAIQVRGKRGQEFNTDFIGNIEPTTAKTASIVINKTNGKGKDVKVVKAVLYLPKVLYDKHVAKLSE